MKYVLNSFLVTLVAAFLTSCGSARTIVHEPVLIPGHMATRQVQIYQGTDTVQIPGNVKVCFESALRKKLYGDCLIQDAPGICLQYRFVQFNEGSRLARYAFGGIGNTGEASLMVEVIYFGCDGTELGRIHTEGKISSGLFGGSSDNAVEKAAEEVSNYTRSLLVNRS